MHSDTDTFIFTDWPIDAADLEKSEIVLYGVASKDPVMFENPRPDGWVGVVASACYSISWEVEQEGERVHGQSGLTTE